MPSLDFWNKGKSSPSDFTIDAQKELGYYISSGKLLYQILNGKELINDKRMNLEKDITWAMLNAKNPATYRKVLSLMMTNITQINSLVHKWVLPFIQPDKQEKKYKAVRGYAKIYISTMNESYLLLSDLEGKHLMMQRVLTMQRIINNYAVYFTITEFLNGISPDKAFVIPSKDRVYVLPPGQMQGNQIRSITPAEFLIRKEAPPPRGAFAERLPEAI